MGYENAGTVEFLLAEGEVYFMEMNTRVQVEHTITEEITGLDIVREQIRIASGLPLSVKQEDIIHRGYALQFRINAEDPKNNFLPSFGKITRYYAPGGPGVRTDTAIYTGYTIPPYYDSMCLKLVVWALTWEEALDRGLRALDDMRVQGREDHRALLPGNPAQRGIPQRPVQHQLCRKPPGTARLLDQAQPVPPGAGHCHRHRRPRRPVRKHNHAEENSRDRHHPA